MNKHIIYRLRSILSASWLLRILVISCLMSHVSCLAAQEERGLTRDGNKLFNKGKYPDSEAAYKKALEKKSNFPEAIFNLGDAMYKQERYDDAYTQFELASRTFTDPKRKALSQHNMGNCQLEKKEYEKAVEAYKQALKLNPNDKDTRYNLAYANEKLREKQKQDQQNKNNKDKKNDKDDQKKDQKDQQKKDDKGGDNKKDGKGDKKDDKDPQKKPGEQPKLSKEQAEKILQSLSPEEKKAMEKMMKAHAKPADVKVEKDW